MDSNDFSNNPPTQNNGSVAQNNAGQTGQMQSQSQYRPNQSDAQVQIRVVPQPETTSGAGMLRGRGNDNRWMVIAIAVVAGLVIGALVVFGIMKATEKPAEECPKCDCPKDTVSTTGDVNFDFLRLEAGSKNILYSPLSIRNGLGLLSAGANGNTKTEIDKVLGDAAVPKYNAIPDKLSLANAVFIRDAFKDKVLPTYVETVQNDYDGEVMYDDFLSSVNMDNWVSDKTLGLIDSIGIQPNEDLKMVLANALAIKMDWKYRFDTDDTGGRTFYKSDGSEMKATTMRDETSAEDILYYTDDDVTAISLPLTSTSVEDRIRRYNENQTTDETADGSSTGDVNIDFVAIMPSSDLDTYVKEMSTAGVDELIGKMTPANEPKDGLLYFIPKFKFDYELDFENDLKALGIKSAFDRTGADFSKMASEPLYVGQAVHKANIDFSEQGIKAAAITVFAMDAAMAAEEEPEPVVINIDHPFAFVIRDADNGTIWFAGTVYEPNSWEDDASQYEGTY